jgi:hypothetical protein
MNEITIMNDLPSVDEIIFADDDDDGGSSWVNQSYGQCAMNIFLILKGGGGVVRGRGICTTKFTCWR